MKRDPFRVLFFLKKTRMLKNGEVSVCMRITVNGTRVENNIRKSIDPALWSQAKETARGKSRRACDLNTYIEAARIRLYQIFCELERQNQPVTVHLLQELFFGQEKPEEVRALPGTMQEHNDQCRALVGTDYALITVRSYESCRRYLSKLIRRRYGKEDLPLAAVNGELVRDVFIFAAFTGQAFIDVQQLAPEHIVRDNNGNLWIRKNLTTHMARHWIQKNAS
mgnify:CR=1 FL=1